MGVPTPFFEKPPLVFWFQAISMSIFGVTAFAVRLPSALATVGVALLVFKIGSWQYNQRAGFAGGLLLLVYPAVYKYGHSGVAATMDVPLVLFGTAFVYWTWRAAYQKRALVPACLAGGLAVLTKGLAAGVFVVIVAPVVAVKWRQYVNTRSVAGVLTTIAVVAPWPLAMWVLHGQRFVNEFIFRQVQRAQGGLKMYGNPVFSFMNYPYFNYISTNIQYAPFVAAATVYGAWRIYREGWHQSKSELFLLWWICAVPTVFALAGGNHHWYILPMVVPITILLGRLVTAVTEEINSIADSAVEVTPLRGRGFLLAGIVVVLAIASMYPVIEADPRSGSTGQKELADSFSNTPEAITIHAQEDIFDSQDGHFVFEFYSDRELTTTTVSRLNNDESIRYAVVSAESVSSLDRPHTVVGESEEIKAVAVRFE